MWTVLPFLRHYCKLAASKAKMRRNRKICSNSVEKKKDYMILINDNADVFRIRPDLPRRTSPSTPSSHRPRCDSRRGMDARDVHFLRHWSARREGGTVVIHYHTLPI